MHYKLSPFLFWHFCNLPVWSHWHIANRSTKNSYQEMVLCFFFAPRIYFLAHSYMEKSQRKPIETPEKKLSALKVVLIQELMQPHPPDGSGEALLSPVSFMLLTLIDGEIRRWALQLPELSYGIIKNQHRNNTKNTKKERNNLSRSSLSRRKELLCITAALLWPAFALQQCFWFVIASERPSALYFFLVSFKTFQSNP